MFRHYYLLYHASLSLAAGRREKSRDNRAYHQVPLQVRLQDFTLPQDSRLAHESNHNAEDCYRQE